MGPIGLQGPVGLQGVVGLQGAGLHGVGLHGVGLQGSLLGEMHTGPWSDLRPTPRVQLGDGAWVEWCPGWAQHADELFSALRTDVEWVAERRWMYDRVVDVPRLVAFFAAGDELPHPLLGAALAALTEHYGAELGEPFATVGLCHYRDGQDSVAWHGDRFGRAAQSDTMVAILSLGAPRPLLLRPRGGGPSRRFLLGHGDLLVMGGSCQRTWDHCIPKSDRPLGPRISVQYRPRGVR